MFYPVFPFPQFAGGLVGVGVGCTLVGLSAVLVLIAFFLHLMVYEDDKWIVKATAQTSLVFMISGLLAPILVGDWAIVVPIIMILGLAWYLATK